MQDSVTIARPYSKAAFDYALSKGKFDQWSQALATLAQTIEDKAAAAFIKNPNNSAKEQTALLLGVLRAVNSDSVDALSPFIHLLATNQRLMVLPDIYVLFEQLRAEHEKKLEVDVVTVYPLSSIQEKALQKALSTRFDAEVALRVSVDKALLGGAMIKAGDWVMDGSVKNKLHRLGMALERL